MARLPKPSRRILSASVIGACALASGVALTATSGWLIVRASEQPVILTLLTAIVAVRTFGMARPAFRYWERLRSHDAALDDLARQRTQVYAALVPLTPGRLGRRGRGVLLGGVVDDLTERVEAQVRVTVPVVATTLTALATAVLCGLVETSAGLAVGGLLLVAAATTALAWRLEGRGQESLTRARGEVARASELVASSALELQAIGAEATALHWVRDAQAAASTAVRRQSAGRALAAGAIPLATAVATLVCAAAALRGDHPAPVAALLVLAPYALGEVFGPLPDVARSLARAQAATARLSHLLDLTPAVVGAGSGALHATTPVPHLSLRAVGASWDGVRTALAHVDVEIPAGQVLAVTGPNGCGKSTLLSVLARQLDPGEGVFTIDGVDVTGLRLDQVRQLFAVVDDEPHVFATTLRQNLLLARPEAHDQQLELALAGAGLASWLAGLAEGLDTRLGAGGRGVSGGERARLAMARALLSGRPVVLLDEPVAHLDHPTAESVLRDLVAARAGRTVVIVSHRSEGLAFADAGLDLARATTPGP